MGWTLLLSVNASRSEAALLTVVISLSTKAFSHYVHERQLISKGGLSGFTAMFLIF